MIDLKVVQVYDDQGHIVTNYHVIESLGPASRHEEWTRTIIYNIYKDAVGSELCNLN